MPDTIRFESFLRLPNFFYRSVGIDLWGTHGGLLQQALFYLCIINVNIWLITEVILALMIFGKNIVQATMTLSYAGFVLVGFIKLYYMWRKKQELTRFLIQMDAIFPRKASQQQSMDVSRHLRQSSIVMSIFSLIFMMLICTYNLYPWLHRELYDCWLHMRSIEKSLPYESYIPWNWHDHWSYYLLYVSQSFAAYHAAAGQIASDLVL
ncbi:odorant receptor 85c-like, partial [Rhagoletis pomonella]|uniref:odorant receptor 85c-like n=1 Tax=Rhagoletis pomonella TaxID=28610 RepID=UPI0017802F10